MTSTQPLWKMPDDLQSKAAMRQFMETINSQYDLSLTDYSDLYQWSINNPAQFWSSMWDYSDIRYSSPYSTVIENSPGKKIYEVEWFNGAKLNFAENLLKYSHQLSDKTAIIFQGEDKVKRQLTFSNLRQQVAATANFLKQNGVLPGDRVAGYLPNMPESVIAMLACSSIGAIWSSCSPDFGFNGVLDRFGQIEPKILFTADGYWFKGKEIDSLETVKKLSESITSLEKIIIVPYLNILPETNNISNAKLFSTVLTEYATDSLEFVQLPFNHPLYIMYSSGTTGVPKCIVHGAGGTLIQHMKELILHTNVSMGDRLFYYTTCGWMMWNWIVSGLATGATLVLYDGSPFYPTDDALIKLVDDNNVNIFGTSAKYLSALEKTNTIPKNTFNLSNLNCILSTGSPLAPESFDYVYRDIKSDIHLASISGGTDIISCFSLGCPIRPVYSGELQCRGLGMAVDIFSESGEPVNQQKGELVCKNAFPSMPLYFWNDEDNKKYHAAYFNRFNNTWAHGDYAELTKHDGLIIYGRSDAVLNPGGVRIGTAEIYRQVEKLPEILESIAIGQEWKSDVRVVLFVKLKSGNSLDETLKNNIRSIIRLNTTPRHVPEVIVEVADIPRTISGKIVELAVRNIVHNKSVENADALANPEALSYFENLPELQED